MRAKYLRGLLSILTVFFLLTSAPFITIIAAQENNPNPGAGLSWSPDGTEFAMFASNGTFIYDRNYTLMRYANYPSTSGTWSSDGMRLLADNRILDAKTLEIITDYAGPFHTWLKDGAEVLTLSNGGKELDTWDVKSSSLVRTIPSPIQIEYAVSSPDSNRILTVVANTILIFDVNQGSLIGQYLLPVYAIGSYVWSFDSSKIAYVAATLVPAETVGSVATVDSKTSMLYTLNIMDINTGKVTLASDPIPESVFALSWSNGISQIAGESRIGSIYVWETDHLTMLTSWSMNRQVTGRFAYSPYGGVLAVGTTSKTGHQSQDNQQATIQANIITGIANDTVQVVVPEVSPEALQSITRICGVQPREQQSVATQITANKLQDFITEISALTDEQIPPGCKADLLSVANALRAKVQ